MAVIELSDEEVMKCRRFALDVVDTNINKYRQRNQFNKRKIIKDIYVGKKAEIAAWKYLNNIGVEEGTYTSEGVSTNEPDFEIYGASRKSFDSDLYDPFYKTKYHVKSMTKENAERWGLSWSFQMEDPLVSRPDEKDVIVLCEVLDKYNVDVKLIMDAVIAQGLYGVPRLYKLKRIKKVLYWEDIAEYFHISDK